MKKMLPVYAAGDPMVNTGGARLPLASGHQRFPFLPTLPRLRGSGMCGMRYAFLRLSDVNVGVFDKEKYVSWQCFTTGWAGVGGHWVWFVCPAWALAARRRDLISLAFLTPFALSSPFWII